MCLSSKTFHSQSDRQASSVVCSRVYKQQTSTSKRHTALQAKPPPLHIRSDAWANRPLARRRPTRLRPSPLAAADGPRTPIGAGRGPDHAQDRVYGGEHRENDLLQSVDLTLQIRERDD